MTKKIHFPLLCLLLAGACSGPQERNNVVIKTGQKDNTTLSTTDQSQENKLIKDWLQGKEWKAESDAAPITTMKLNADGVAEFSYGKDPWVYQDGFFAMRSLDFVKWPFKKIDDNTFTLFVEPTQKTFTYKFVRNI